MTNDPMIVVTDRQVEPDAMRGELCTAAVRGAYTGWPRPAFIVMMRLDSARWHR